MKDRRPRKLKKLLKKKFAKISAFKMIQAALSSVFAAAQLYAIRSKPIRKDDPNGKTEKALAITDVTLNAANSIQSIMSEKPTTWKEC